MVQGRCNDGTVEPGIVECFQVCNRSNTATPEEFPVVRSPHGLKCFPVKAGFRPHCPDVEDDTAFELPTIGFFEQINRFTPGRNDPAIPDIEAQEIPGVLREIAASGLRADNIPDMVTIQQVIR
jgi:hypothetical protein